MNLGPTELIIVLVIVVLIFGVGKLGDTGAAVGKAIREFRHAVSDDTTPEHKPVESTEPKAS